MSRPLAAKSMGAYLKYVLNARLAPAPPRHLESRRGDAGLVSEVSVDPAAWVMWLSARVRDEQRSISEGDPLPPADRTPPVAPLCIDTLYREQRPRLLRFLRRRTSNDNAGDLVQQAFERLVILDDDRRAAIANPVAYLRQTAANLAADQARSDLRRSTAMHVSLDEIDRPGPDQLVALETRDMLLRLEQALQRLKPRTREIFLAHRIDGYSYVEIAARTGLSVKGVEKHMSRAIAFVDRVLSRR